MNKIVKVIISFMLVAAVFISIPAIAHAEEVEKEWTVDDYIEFEYACITMAPGTTQKMYLRTMYDYTYFMEGATSSGTYLECDFKSGSRYVVFHIGADEQAKQVNFHFYIVDDRLESADQHKAVEVYIKGASKAVATTQNVTLADGTTGSLKKTSDTVAMLYNAQNVGMASFSLSNGNGNMLAFTYQGIVNNGSNYFSLKCASNNAVVKISESDKSVMIANGYAGICVNGIYKNW